MSLKIQKHLRYWRLCANALPNAYQSYDASHMSLAFFIVSALDLLGVLRENSSQDIDPKFLIGKQEKQQWCDWIYSLQILPSANSVQAGFRGFNGTNLRERADVQNEFWDPGHVPNTFFALCTLLILEDDLSRVHRSEILKWLSRLQRVDGSFGETLGIDGRIEGGRDLRFSMCGVSILYLLSVKNVDAVIDFRQLEDYILDCQTHDGGFSESPGLEPHSGFTYCAIATLDLLNRLSESNGTGPKEALRHNKTTYARWMVARQTDILNEGEFDEGTDSGDEGEAIANAAATDEPDQTIPEVYGFNGREGKIADTCYCFWNSGALAILGLLPQAGTVGTRRYLLEVTQHVIGGFAKGPDSPPDVMHSFLGLAALSLMGEEGLQPVDPALCLSKSAVARLETIVH